MNEIATRASTRVVRRMRVEPRSRFVMITGVGPGIGKSTLAEGLAGRAAEFSCEVDLFGEEQIFTRPAFAEIGRAFRDRDEEGSRIFPSGEMLLDGYRRVIGEAGQRVIVFDWTCLGMISDLPWAEGRPDVLLAHAREVREVAHARQPVVVNLVADVEVAVARATAQRGSRWLRRYAHLAAMEGARSRVQLAAVAERIRQLPFESLELEAFRAGGWPIWEIDASPSAPDVLDAVVARLWRADA